MYIWIHDKYSSTSFKQRLWQRKIVLIWQNYFFKIMCVTVVQWSRSCLHVQINRVRLPASDAVFCFLIVPSFFLFFFFFFPVWSLFLNTIFPLDRFFFILTADPAGHALASIYFKLKSGVLFWQRDFKSSWSAYWPSLRPDENHKLSRHVPPLKQLNFFQC